MPLQFSVIIIITIITAIIMIMIIITIHILVVSIDNNAVDIFMHIFCSRCGS